MMQRYYFLLENMYRAMMIFWLTCLVGYPRTSAPEPILPSIVFSVIYMFLFNGYEKPLPTVVYNLLSGTGHMWFLPMLFWCFVFVFLAEKTRLSTKWIVGASFIMLFASVLPLPFRINTAMYYFVFFYIGYCIKRYELSFSYNGSRKYQLLIAGFVFAFMLKINVCEIDDLLTGGGNSACTIFDVVHIY